MPDDEQKPANEDYARRVARDFVADQREHLQVAGMPPWRRSLLHRLTALILLIGSGLVFAANVENDPGASAGLRYLAIAAACFAVWLGIPWRPGGGERRSCWLLAIAMIAGMAAFSRYDWRIEERTSADGKIRRTSYWRWSNKPFYLSIDDRLKPNKIRQRRAAGDFFEGFTFAGPLTPTGKWHGKWTTWDGIEQSENWYWYGEGITEGQWHERTNTEPICGPAGIGGGGCALIAALWIGAGCYLARQFIHSRGPAFILSTAKWYTRAGLEFSRRGGV